MALRSRAAAREFVKVVIEFAWGVADGANGANGSALQRLARYTSTPLLGLLGLGRRSLTLNVHSRRKN